MKKQGIFFVARRVYKSNQGKEVWFDLYEDWNLIESSFATQYGIRLRVEHDMPWGEFISLTSGLIADTPLGQIISIRGEKDKDVLKNFTPSQREIRNKWRNKSMNKIVTMDKKEAERQVQEFQEMMKNAFGK